MSPPPRCFFIDTHVVFGALYPSKSRIIVKHVVNQDQFLFSCGHLETLGKLQATIGTGTVAKPTVTSALNLFRACTLTVPVAPLYRDCITGLT
jgi:hypothetical protein